MTCLDGIATGGTMTIATGISQRKEIRVIFCSSGPIKAEGKTEIDEATLAAVRKLEGDVELAKTDENNSELRLILRSLPYRSILRSGALLGPSGLISFLAE